MHILDVKKDMIKLKRKHFTLKENEIEKKNEYLRKKLERKEKRNQQSIQIEKNVNF